jgi:hypothetical protein
MYNQVYNLYNRSYNLYNVVQLFEGCACSSSKKGTGIDDGAGGPAFDRKELSVDRPSAILFLSKS